MVNRKWIWWELADRTSKSNPTVPSSPSLAKNDLESKFRLEYYKTAEWDTQRVQTFAKGVWSVLARRSWSRRAISDIIPSLWLFTTPTTLERPIVPPPVLAFCCSSPTCCWAQISMQVVHRLSHLHMTVTSQHFHNASTIPDAVCPSPGPSVHLNHLYNLHFKTDFEKIWMQYCQ